MKKILSLITIFALILSFSTNLYVFANDKDSENVTSVNEVQNNKNKSSYLGIAIATLVAATSTVAVARIAYIRGVKNGKADYWLSDEKVKAAISSAWDWTSENVPYAVSSAWNWITNSKKPSVEETSAEEPSAEEPSAEEPSVEETSAEEPSVEETSAEETSAE